MEFFSWPNALSVRHQLITLIHSKTPPCHSHCVFSKVLLQSPVTWDPGKSLSYGSSGAHRPTEGYLSRLDLSWVDKAPRISIRAVIWILSLNWTYGQLYEQTTTYQVSSRLQRWPNLRVTSGELTNHSYLGIGHQVIKRHNTVPTKVKPIHKTSKFSN